MKHYYNNIHSLTVYGFQFKQQRKPKIIILVINELYMFGG